LEHAPNKRRPKEEKALSDFQMPPPSPPSHHMSEITTCPFGTASVSPLM
jgi:hypothetical protein